MADVKIIDIDNEQWNMKDQEARNKIANLEKLFITEDLPDVKIDLITGYTASDIKGYAHYKIGKIHFITIRIDNLAGTNIGTNFTANIASVNLYPKKETSFILNDFKNRAVLRCFLSTDGTIAVGESVGVTSGSNNCFGELIFAEA